MPILFPQRQVISTMRPAARPVVLARRARRMREFNDCNLPRGDSDGGRFGANDDPRCKSKGIPFGVNEPSAAGQAILDAAKAKLDKLAADPNVYKRPGYYAKKGQQPYDTISSTAVTDAGTEEALRQVARRESNPEAIADKQFEYMEQHEPAVVQAAQELHESAKQAHPEFVQTMTGLAQTLGIDLTYENVESEAFLSQTNEAIGLGPIKAVKRTSVKAAEYDGNVLRVKDMLRSTIVVDKAKDMADALTRLKEVMEVSVKDNVKQPAPGGWRAYNVIARLKESGMLVEVQITTRKMMRAKKDMHHLFAQARTMPDDHPSKPGLIREQERIYNRAWRASGGHAARGLAAIAAIAAIIGTLQQV